MKFSTGGTVALALVLHARAQDITSLPPCAQTPILTAFSTSGCSLTDIACVCNKADVINGLVESITSVCSSAEVAATSEFAISLCDAYGVTLNLPDTVGGATSSQVATSTSAQVAANSVPSDTSTLMEPTRTSSVVATSLSGTTTASEPAQYTGAGNRLENAPLFALMGVGALCVAAVL